MNNFLPLGMNYRTTPRPISSYARAFPGLVFYSRFVMIICNASIRSKQGRYDKTQWCRSSFDILKAMERIGVRFDISGVEHLQGLKTPCVVVANHMSVLETVILPYVIQSFRDVTFIVKESLMDYPVFKHILRARNPIVVNRVNPRQDLKTVMAVGAERLKQGISVVVFPQTTRSIAFDPHKFNSLGVKLAARAMVPVVPLALATDAWGNGQYIKEFGKIDVAKTVHFSFGRPMPIDGRGIAEHQAIIEFIRNQLTQWRKQLPS
jgi:1-acyl-sn-glycerol-3-phosphate acyltransferase